MSGKYIRTAGENDTTAMLLAKVEELIAAFNGSTAASALTKINATIDAYASLKADHAALVAKYNTLKGALDAIVTKLNLETLTQGPYANAAVVATDGSSAAPAHAAVGVDTPLTTAASMFE